MPETTPRPAETCGASTGAIRLGDQPPHHIGPCVLRKDHDGPVHQAQDGTQWAGDVGRAPEAAPRPDVPDEIPARLDRLAAALLSQLAAPMAEAVKWVVEAETLAIEAEVERRVREQVAAGTRDLSRRWAAKARQAPTLTERERREAMANVLAEHAERIARGEAR